MLISGFVDGKLIYIIEFPFKTQSFIDKIKRQLNKNFPSGKDELGHFLRSANFDYRDYVNSVGLKKVYILPKEELKNYKDFINSGFYDKLLSL